MRRTHYECYLCGYGPVYDEGLCARCYSRQEAEYTGLISDCNGCGEIHDVIDLCPEMQAEADEVVREVAAQQAVHQ